MNKKMILLIMSLILLLNISYAFGETTEIQPADIVITLNEEVMILEEPPYIINGRTLLPLRYIFEPLGLEVSWVEETRTALGKKDGLTIKLPIGSVNAVVNGNLVKLEVPATIINDRTYVPVRFVAESTGAIVSWNEKTRTVSIKADIEEYDNLSINQLLISIYGDVANLTDENTGEIRDKYHTIIKKINEISEKNDLNIIEFKNVVAELGKSINFEISTNQSLKYMLEKFNLEKQKNTAKSILDLKSKYEVFEFDSGDKYYGPLENGSVSGFGLYEFASDTILIGQLKNSTRNGYATNAYDTGYQYANYVNDILVGYEYSYNLYEKTAAISLIQHKNGKREGKSYELRYDINGNLLYDKYETFLNDKQVGISEINFTDGTNRFDRAGSVINDIVVRVDKDKEYFILPTNSDGISVSSRTGFGYKRFSDGVEYIGEFFEEARLADGLYYGMDDSSNLSTNLMDQVANEIIKENTNEIQTEEEKIKVLHDYLADHIMYDPYSDGDNNYADLSHTAYGALVDGVAVCDGYAEAFKYLLDKVNIETVMIFGEAYDDGTAFTQVENHAWNLVKVNDKYFHYDLTWDDDDLNGTIHYDYYKKSNGYFDDTHWWNGSDYLEYIMY